MKNWKKNLALVLALVMCLTLATPAMAADEQFASWNFGRLL